MTFHNPVGDVLNKQQAARLLGISARTLDRRHAEGIGPPRVKHGNKVVYLKSSILRWLERLEEEPVRLGGS
ncbi:DNA-binding protein [Rhodobacteraceae bacterium CCMM004]|nr:DNA-binding protein [Rhodobacteraceae bacterium CCMM004]